MALLQCYSIVHIAASLTFPSSKASFRRACRNGPTGLPATTDIGKAVTIGAGSLLRSCKIEDMAVVGERSIIMEGSILQTKAILLPGTVVPPAKMIPHGQVWGGNPARFVRNLTHDEVQLDRHFVELQSKSTAMLCALLPHVLGI